MNRRRLLIAVAATTIMAVLALTLVRLWLVAPRAAAAARVPYTVTLEQTRTLPSGERRYANTVVYAVRSDGSMVLKQTSSPRSTHPEVFRTIFLSSGTAIQSRDLAGVVSTGRGSHLQPLRSPTDQCLVPSSALKKPTAEVYNGTETQHGLRTAKISDGPSTHWFALDYGCALVKARMEWENGSVSEKNLVALVKGEPDAALFHVPKAYQEVPPSKWHFLSGDIPASDQARMRKLDEQYHKHQPRSQ